MKNQKQTMFTLKMFGSFMTVGTLAMSGMANAEELLNLVTSEKGMHRISYQQLDQAGADLSGLKARRIGLSLNGEPVAVLAKGQDRANGSTGVFGPGAYIEFYAELADSLYTQKQVFTVHYLSNAEIREGKRVLIRPERARVNLTQSLAQTYDYTATIHENNTYSFVSPSSTDPWHFGTTFSFRPTPTYTFTLSDVVGGSATAKVDAEIYGFVDFDIEGNDHHFDAEVNGIAIGDQQFDGSTATTLSAENVTVVSGDNTFKYNYRAIAGVPFDRIALNKIDIIYPRVTSGVDGYLEGRFGAGQALVSNVGNSKARVYRKDGNALKRITGTKNVSGGTAFSTNGLAGDYIVVSQELDAQGNAFAYKLPEIQVVSEFDNIDQGAAEYLIIAHPSLMGAELDELVALRSEQYSVKVVDINQVYAQFGNYVVGSDAIENYVEHAVSTMSTKYVVLLGSDSYDYKNHKFESVSLIPTKYVTTQNGGLNITQTPSDSAYGDIDKDGVPDVAIARISARTKSELGYVVTKIKDYADRSDYLGLVLIAADKDDIGNGVNFTQDAEDLMNAMPDSWRSSLRSDYRAFPEQDGHQVAHDKLAAAINNGVSVVSYIGHSSQYSWAYTTPPMLSVGDIAGLANQGKPAVVTQWGCWNTYYVDPNGNTMGDAFLVGGTQGAVTVLGASGLTSSTGERALGIELNKRMFEKGVTLGDAIIAAKQALALKEDYPAIQMSWSILGDPAIMVNP
jgi:hypothetical protein